MSSVRGCALWAVALAAGSVAEAGFTWSVTSVRPMVAVGLVGDEPAFGNEPAFTTGVGSSDLPDGIKLFGNIDDTPTAMRLTGAEFAAALGDSAAPFFLLEIAGDALVDAPPVDGQHFVVDWDFGFEFTGGVARWHAFGAGFGVFDSENGFLAGYGVSTGAGETDLDPGTHERAGVFEYTFFESTNLGNQPTAARVEFLVSIVFKWTGYAEGDAFVLSIPDNSIDITVVPAPASAALAGLAGIAACRRRRRA